MVLFDEEIELFSSPIYASDSSKYRAEYIKQITAKVTAEVDYSEAGQLPPEGQVPRVEVEATGEDPAKHLKFIFKYLKGDKGDKGDKSVIRLTIREYNELKKHENFDKELWYFVTSNSDAMRYIYAGDTLVAKSDKTGNIFPITFPLTFSN